MKKFKINEITNMISAAIRIGGAALGPVNPTWSIGTVALGEFLPIIVNKANETRQKILLNSINCHIKKAQVPLNYEENPDACNQLLDMIRKAMLSESGYTIFLMGKIAAKALDDNRKYTQNELQLIDALYRMNDYDFINFLYICNQFDEVGRFSGDILTIDETDLHDEADSKKDNILFTLKKLNGLNLFDYVPAAMFDDENGFQTYSSGNFYNMNSLTYELIELVNGENVGP